MAVAPTTLLLVILYTGGMVSYSPNLFLSADEHEALTWLNAQAELGDVVLASTQLSVFVPARTSLRTVSGNAFTTPNSEETERQVVWFYSGSISPHERRNMLRKWAVDYVILGPRERSHGARDLSSEDGVELAAQFNDVYVFEVSHTVVPEGAQASDCPS